MTHRALALILTTAAMTCSPALSVAQSDDAVRAELAGIRSSLEQIVRLLQAGLDREERSLLLRRIEIKNDRLLPVEKSIRDATDHQRHLQTEELRLRAYLDELERKAFDDESSERGEDARNERQQIETELERISGEQWGVEQQLQSLEAERRDLQDEILSLEAELDRISRPADR